MTIATVQNDAAKKEIKEALKTASDSLTLIEAERDLIKELSADVCKKYDLDKKIFKKMIKTFHKQNFTQEVEMNDDFQAIYETIVK